MREIQVSAITALVKKLCMDANYYLPDDIRQSFVEGQGSDAGKL